MAAISIDTIHCEGSRLEGWLRSTGSVSRFVGDGPFVVEYGRSIEEVPDGILAIPLLAHLCPVAWASGADVYVDRVDATFARALEHVKASMLAMHGFLEGGRLFARRTQEYDIEVDGERGLLYTGGVDSTHSYIAHREESPRLIGVRGWTVTPDETDDEAWQAQRERVEQFAESKGLAASFIDTNALAVLNHPLLLAHFKRHVDGGWYSSVGHGLGLLGLTAPLCVAAGIGHVYMAATHWGGVDLAWGSRPDIDDYVAWSGTRCHHDGYDRTRQERLDAIAAYIRTVDPDLVLQTCPRQSGGNCGHCEKCYRTALGLRLAGLDPTQHGYPLPSDAYTRIIEAFESGQWILGRDELHMWRDIRARIAQTEPETPTERAFFSWLERADLESIVEQSDPPVHQRVLRSIAATAPPSVYDLGYPLWRIVR